MIEKAVSADNKKNSYLKAATAHIDGLVSESWLLGIDNFSQISSLKFQRRSEVKQECVFLGEFVYTNIVLIYQNLRSNNKCKNHKGFYKKYRLNFLNPKILS